MEEWHSRKLSRETGADGVSYTHWCPGCKGRHLIWTERSERPVWSFNGDQDRPTFQPSIRCFTTLNGETRTLCHYFLTDGKLHFCADSPHELSGKVVDLPDLPGA